jgi:hypothetical protein
MYERKSGWYRHFAYGRPEIDAYFRKSHKVIIPLTVQSILDGDLAQKLA